MAVLSVLRSWGGGGGGGGAVGQSLVWPSRVCAAEQGMVNSCAKRNKPAS